MYVNIPLAHCKWDCQFVQHCASMNDNSLSWHHLRYYLKVGDATHLETMLPMEGNWAMIYFKAQTSTLEDSSLDFIELVYARNICSTLCISTFCFCRYDSRAVLFAPLHKDTNAFLHHSFINQHEAALWYCFPLIIKSMLLIAWTTESTNRLRNPLSPHWFASAAT